ncbi:MAG TPA: ABC transporter permease subunit [Clostridia bacterium]|nr:ABC transporter permease subunit [Clostridia bacterium]
MLAFLKRKYGSYWQLYTFLMLPVAYIIVFNYIPMVGAQIAFKKFNIMQGIWDSPWVGLKNFYKFFSAYQFQRVFANTLTLSIYSILAAFPFPILFALMLNTIERLRYKKLIQTVTYIPHFISTVVLVGMLMQIFHPLTGVYGVIAKMLTGSVPQDLFALPQVFPHLYVWSGVWQTFGYSSIIYIAALTNVSAELHEAAEVDGAGRFKRVLHIDLPALLPTIIIMLILRTGSILSIGFEKAFLMQNTLNLSKSEIISTFVYKKGLASGASNDYSYSAAIGMFNSVVNLIMITLVNAIARKCGESSLW